MHIVCCLPYQVVRAESISGDPGGPYRHSEVVLPPFHHNPTIVGPTPDGYYLLFFIGTDRPQAEIDCRKVRSSFRKACALRMTLQIMTKFTTSSIHMHADVTEHSECAGAP